MKRIFLFVATNLAILLAVSIVFNVLCAVLGLDPGILAEEGINYETLALYSLVFGMAGSVISLLLSKPMAKFSTGARVIDGTEGEAEAWLVATVADLANRAGVKCPEVAIYEGEPNAFATGAFRNSALVAVSTGIMRSMTRNELRAVLGHEMSHVVNGDMVTMSLLQGILNACVLFLAYVIGYLAEGALSGRDGRRRRGGGGIAYLVRALLRLVLGLAASLVVYAFSRHREYGADAGSARLLGSPSDMIAALRRLGNLQPGVLPDSLKAMGFGGKSMRGLFATHPSLEDRIAALQSLSV
ncbi:MAG: protease HtpX [Kiritimatiellae bacterium]|nr:protease HtpX [Kiritimatiellia bacterium]